MSDAGTDLIDSLLEQRDALRWKLEGLSERDARMPMTPTGTNLLGLVKHVASVTVGYLGDCVGRPFPEELPWFADTAEENADMWAAPGESMAEILAFWDRAWAHAEAVVRELPLDAPAHVPWWGPERADTTLGHLLVRCVAEVARHAGHADIVREAIDGAVGHRRAVSDLPEHDEAWWAAYVERLRAAAEAAGDAR
ncbi:DinB family protein [Agrococcus baldri]|nr:DinB family protein [Agrococcus baldri]